MRFERNGHQRGKLLLAAVDYQPRLLTIKTDCECGVGAEARDLSYSRTPHNHWALVRCRDNISRRCRPITSICFIWQRAVQPDPAV